ncbi:MAG: AAA-like domain-containing protein [Candidatus Aminicenantes bacterium]|nr:AAA-like domain-containing protein [Candidatus Aminicenantes bacterium]
MRRFSSYGPLDPEAHFFAPRENLITTAYNRLVGENPSWGGHYFTVWAPRQTGKTWLMQEVIEKIDRTGQYHTAIITMERAKAEKEEKEIVSILIEKMQIAFSREFPPLQKINDIHSLFTASYFQKPVILILDEFDSLEEERLSSFAGVFRDMFITRTNERKKSSGEKTYLLHGLALIGVRSVLGIENLRGSPFNVQRSLHIPNLTYPEVAGMFEWYEKESGQQVEETVVQALYEETRGQPGLTCWFGELLTETYNSDPKKPIALYNFKEAYGAALNILPNNNILNLISKVNKPPYDEIVMEFFKTGEKIAFNFDNKEINYLYMNGVIDEEKVDADEYYLKFSCPFVQKRIFNYFSNRIFSYLGRLIDPLDAMKDAIDEETLHIPNIIKRYQDYLKKNHEVFFKNVPRRKTDLKIYEAVYHFNLYRYLVDLLRARGVEVVPQFPTGNGKIDLILKYREKIYAIELKSFTDMYRFERGIDQAAEYAQQLGLKEIVFLVFVELSGEEAKPLELVVDRSGIKVITLPVAIL